MTQAGTSGSPLKFEAGAMVRDQRKSHVGPVLPTYTSGVA